MPEPPCIEPPRIETPRLLLTWPSAAQIDDYHASIVGTDMFDTIIWDGPERPEDLHAFWARATKHDPRATEEFLQVALIEKDGGRCIGGMSLRPVERDPAIVDVGYALAPAFHGRGYATEALGALVDLAFAERGAERIFAGIFVGNLASRRVVEKLGFQLEGTLRRTVRKRGQWIDEWILALIRPDWEARAARR